MSKVPIGEWDPKRGCDVGQALAGTLPEPTRKLVWGKNIPPDILAALKDGERATLYDEDDKPYSSVLMDSFGTIREKRL